MLTSTRHGVRQPTSVTIWNPCILGVSTAQCVYTLQFTASITATIIRVMFTYRQGITLNTRMSIMQLCTRIMHCHFVLLQCEISCLLWLELDRNNLWFKRDWRFTRLQHLKVAQTLERMWCSTWCSTWCACVAASITQNNWKTIDLSTRLWWITTEFVGFIPQSLLLF